MQNPGNMTTQNRDHSDRRQNLVAFVKCSKPGCTHCSKCPVRELVALEKLIGGSAVPCPVPAVIPPEGFSKGQLESVEHYLTYLEQHEKGTVPELRDQYRPGIAGSLESRRCDVETCAGYMALNPTDLARHKRHFH